MMIHYFKAHPEPFEAVAVGTKLHEVRKDDRAHRPRPGDLVVLREWQPDGSVSVAQARVAEMVPDRKPELIGADGKYTGRELRVRVTHVTAPGTWGLPADVYVMSVRIES